MLTTSDKLEDAKAKNAVRAQIEVGSASCCDNAAWSGCPDTNTFSFARLTRRLELKKQLVKRRFERAVPSPPLQLPMQVLPV